MDNAIALGDSFIKLPAMSETEEYEDKGYFSWEYGKPYVLVKTIVAFANTDGGKLTLKNVDCDPRCLDSARLDDFVNKYVQPRLGGIKSTCENGVWEIRVQRSMRAPHVTTCETHYTDEKGKIKSSFHAGQIYVRHSSKSEPATGEDIHRMIQGAMNRPGFAGGSNS